MSINSSYSVVSALNSLTNEMQIKMVIMGDSSVGKSAMLQRFCCESFLHIPIPTIGI